MNKLHLDLSSTQLSTITPHKLVGEEINNACITLENLAHELFKIKTNTGKDLILLANNRDKESFHYNDIFCNVTPDEVVLDIKNIYYKNSNSLIHLFIFRKNNTFAFIYDKNSNARYKIETDYPDSGKLVLEVLNKNNKSEVKYEIHGFSSLNSYYESITKYVKNKDSNSIADWNGVSYTNNYRVHDYKGKEDNLISNVYIKKTSKKDLYYIDFFDYVKCQFRNVVLCDNKIISADLSEGAIDVITPLLKTKLIKKINDSISGKDFVAVCEILKEKNEFEKLVSDTFLEYIPLEELEEHCISFIEKRKHYLYNVSSTIFDMRDDIANDLKDSEISNTFISFSGLAFNECNINSHVKEYNSLINEKILSLINELEVNFDLQDKRIKHNLNKNKI